jgi:hypothetical protein
MIDSYPQLQAFITNVLTQNNELNGVANSPHLSFWTTMTYQQFTTGNVPHVVDSANKPMPILVVGNSAKSNLILSLRGAANTDFDSQNGSIGQMPANGPPMFTDAQINEIASWIDRGCPQ